MKISLEIPSQRIADLFTAAFEDRIGSAWVKAVTVISPIVVDPKHPTYPWYAHGPNFEHPKFLMIVKEQEEDETVITHKVTARKLRPGIERFAKEHPRHFGDWMDGRDDVTTAEVFLQVVTFGEVKYG